MCKFMKSLQRKLKLLKLFKQFSLLLSCCRLLTSSLSLTHLPTHSYGQSVTASVLALYCITEYK